MPIDINHVTEFAPEKVPTVASLKAEIDSRGRADGTSFLMKPYVDVLDKFVKQVIRQEKKASKASEPNQGGDLF